MNEVSGGKQEMSSNSAWEALASQSNLPMHHHQLIQQEANPPVTQVIVPTPVKLQAAILPPTQNVEHCPPLGHMQQTLIPQVKIEQRKDIRRLNIDDSFNIV